MTGGARVKKLFDELIEVLTDELNTHKDLLSLTNKKTDIIIAGHVNELDKITQIENTIIITVGKLEERREKVVENIKKQLEIQEDLSMSDILKYSDEETTKEIEKLKDEFLEIIGDLKNKNQLNNVLIQDNLEFINLNLQLLTNSLEQETYNSKTEKSKSVQNSSLFDTKA